MKVLQLNDTHEGQTKSSKLRKFIKKVAQEEFDVLLHNGDYCGGFKGHKTVNSTLKLIREFIPDKPFVSVIGNHDFWMGNTEYPHSSWKHRHPSLLDFQENYRKIQDSFKKYNVHFLDQDGPYRHPDFKVTIVGHSGWYHHPNPIEHINDFYWLPYGIEGDTHRFLQKAATNGLEKNLALLTEEDRQREIVFASHFPVILAKPSNPTKYDWEKGFSIFCGNPFIGQMMQDDYGCRYFFNGHAHQLHRGPLRYETGTDYAKPAFHIVEVLTA